MTLALLTRPLRPLRSIALGGAWFFIVVSLVHLVGAIAVKWQEPAGVFKLYHTVVGGRSYDAPWLTYDGTVGLVIALFQATVVAAAAAVTATRMPGSRMLTWRRAGHVALLGWSALWATDLVWLASIDGQLNTIAQAALLCVLLTCTGARAAIGWRGPAPGPGPRPAHGADGGPTTMIRDQAFDRNLREALPETPPGAADAPTVLQRLAVWWRAAIDWTARALRGAQSGAATVLKSAARLLDRGSAT